MCDLVFYKQSLLFLRPDTLEGKKLQLYVILKFLKFVSGADVTSFKVIVTILVSVHLNDNIIYS